MTSPTATLRAPIATDTVLVDDARDAAVALRSHAWVIFRKVVPWLGLAFAGYVLLPWVGQAGATVDALRHARWAWLAAVALASASTYLMAAVALVAVAGVPLRLRPTWAVQLAAAFTNRLAPAGLGGMATNVRYLTSAGSDRGGAVMAVGMNSLAGFLVHFVSVAAVLPLLGAGGSIRAPGAPDLPDRWPLLVAGLALLAFAGAVRWGRTASRKLGPGLRSAWARLQAIAAHPTRAAALFGGVAGVTAGYALGLVAAVHAFGGGVGVGKVVAVYLSGAAVAAAAPTPGGVGPLEAALVAGLTGVGLAPAQAVASVLVYRVITYWMPVVPGLALYRLLRARAVL